MITDNEIEKDGKRIKKLSLIHVDGDEKLCDGCDERKVCASLSSISGDVSIVCKDCLNEILKHFENNSNRPQTYLRMVLDERDDYFRVGYRETTEIEKLRKWRKEMLECSNVIECKIIKIEGYE